MTRPNPYALDRLWPPETHAAYASMPKNRQGHVVSLPYTPDRDLAAAETAWREWCAVTPKALWPTWVDTWKDVKRLRERRG